MGNEPGRLRHRLALALVAAVLVGVGGVIGIAASGGTQTKETDGHRDSQLRPRARRSTRTSLPARTTSSSSPAANATATGAAAASRRMCPRSPPSRRS